ncbi:MAG: molybdopterin-dependent oxidoreductase [Epsilonproteobacteria bacterium]|nr:molybdopterin-dependent oxidoreductase [Campylobacterota bacterium]
MNTTACPLDCYDACCIEYINHKLKAIKDGHTQGFLCPHINHYNQHEVIQQPRYKGKEITIKEALLILRDMLNESKTDEILHYRGSGNFALMQEVVDHFFASFGATLTEGSLCDSAGEAGIINGRGSNKNMPLSEIQKSEVVIFWGRNPHTTSSHILPLIKDKTIIVIDPIRTKIAKMAKLHIQLKPHSDMLLAMLLSRFLFIEGSCDEKYLEEFASEYEEYYELTQSIRIKATLEDIDVTLGQVGDLLSFLKNKKVAIVCGVGMQKYRDGADVMRAIDAFALMLGIFGKEGSGVAYLGNSKECILSPFNTKAKRVSKVDTKFENYKTVFIQCANPLSQMPNSIRVKESIKKTKNIIYFGLYENETSKIADLIIPAKSFLHKDDIRTSYSHNGMMFMNKLVDSAYGISEYDLSAYLCKEFNIKIDTQDNYLTHFKNFAIRKIDGLYYVQNRKEIPYKDGFDTEDGEFVFLEEIDTKNTKNENFYLITSKSPTSLNSQFYRDRYIYIHPSLGFKDAEILKISNKNGSVELKVKLCDDIRKDCILIHSGTKGVNNLTTSKHSFEGKCAIFQEDKVSVSKLKDTCIVKNKSIL